MLDQPPVTGTGQPSRKRAAILAAATRVFLDSGFRGTSMDVVARAAGVAKQTVYQHFADKERLFAAVVREAVDVAADPVAAEIAALGAGGDLGADLVDLAARQLRAVLQPNVLALRRLVIAEAGRFPELGRVFHDKGPARTVAALASRFADLAREGALRADDPGAAASDFNWLLMAAPVTEAMLLGRTDFPDAELAATARRAVATFLRAYGPVTG